MPASSRALGGGISWVAGGTIAPSVFVRQTSTAFTIVQATSGEALLGVMQEGQRNAPGITGSDSAIAALVGDAGTFNIYNPGDRCRVKVIAAVNPGVALKASTGGLGISHTTGTANIGGFTLTAGNAGDLVEILVYTGTLVLS